MRRVPAFRDLGEPGSKMARLELQGGFAESKTTASLHQSYPTFIQRAGVVDGGFQLADGEVGVQGAPEHSTEDHATGGVEFLVSEVLDGEPDDGTKCDQGDAGDVVCGGTEEEGEDRRQFRRRHRGYKRRDAG